MSNKSLQQKELDKQIAEQEENDRTNAIGLLGDSEANVEDREAEEEDAAEKEAILREQTIEDAMCGKPVKIGRFTVRPFTLSTFALLRQMKSEFLSFVPLLSLEDRDKLIALSQQNSRTDEENIQYIKLVATAKAEAELIENPYLETLKFMAVFTDEITEEEAQDIIFDESPAALRRAGFAFGTKCKPEDMDDLTSGISWSIAAAQDTKVVPVKKKGQRDTKKKRSARRGRHK